MSEFDKLTNHGTTVSPTMVRQSLGPVAAHYLFRPLSLSKCTARVWSPWFDRLTNQSKCHIGDSIEYSFFAKRFQLNDRLSPLWWV